MNNSEWIFDHVEKLLEGPGFTIISSDQTRPWGGFFVIYESQATKFAEHFFAGKELEKLQLTGKLSPKVLIVAQGKRLSWQYHQRRAELWCCIEGPVAVATSDSDIEKGTRVLQPGDMTSLKQGERHRLIGLDKWGVVAEIWQHTDPCQPSDEDDIVRLQDDFGRGSAL